MALFDLRPEMISSISRHDVGKRKKVLELGWPKYECGEPLILGILEARSLPIFAKKSLKAFAID